MSSINIFPTDNDVTLVNDNRIVNVEDNVEHTTVEVTQPITNVIHVLTGPRGLKGDQGDSTSLFVSGSNIFGTQISASFNNHQYDSDTGLIVTQSAEVLSAKVSIGSHIRDIIVDGQTTLIATGSDQLEMIAGDGIDIFTSITDTNGDGVEKELSFALDATVARTGSNSFVGDQTITGSLIVSGSSYFTGSLIPESSGSGQGIWDLGSAANPWKSLYLASASINFVDSTGSVISTLSGEADGVKIGSGGNSTLITTSSIQLIDDAGNTTSLTAGASTGSFYGSFTLEPQTSTPTVVPGKLFFSASNALYVGFF